VIVISHPPRSSLIFKSVLTQTILKHALLPPGSHHTQLPVLPSAYNSITNMLLHYPQQYEHHISPTHYQSFESSSTSFPLQTSLPALATPISLSQRSLHSSQVSMPASQQQPSNPTVRIHQSTPSPGDGAQSNNNQLMLAQGAFLGSGRGSERFPSSRYLDTLSRKTGKYHKRLSSASSINSAGAPSPHDYTSPYCQIVNSDSSSFSPLENVDCVSSPHQNHFPKSLPTPVGTPTSNQFMPPGYQNVPSAQETHRYSASAMRRIHSATGDDDGSAFTFSGPQSVSSMSHTSPATPHTNYEVEYDEKSFGQGENLSIINAWMDEYSPFFLGFSQSAVFSQSLHDVFADQSYNSPASPSFSQQSQPNAPHTSSNLSPYRNMNVFATRLQAANQDHLANRTGSPVTSATRELSPFKAYNQIQELGSDISPQNRMTAMTQAMMDQPRLPTAPKSISPKELMLEDPELDEADTTPLFRSQFDQSSSFANRRPNANMSDFPDQNGMFGRPFSAVSTQVPQQYPFISERRRQHSDIQDGESEQVPDFPAHLLSMETTVEEGSSEPSSSQQTSGQQPAQQIQRPDDTSSDCGTYTCTYRGCTLRFETPAKLQKHKREAHRQTSPNAASTSSSGGATSAAAASAGLTDLDLRNSQAGPHKCERTNPSTGKPCNSIFSRPYDLTRHEDTIHNARKQKVRCHLCAEEKTFSRNDALTRHMRVVHPDVDWPGKTRRGKGRD
jgi:Zinc finger, C2H2 type